MIFDQLYTHVSVSSVAASALAVFLLVHLIPYLIDPLGLRKYPGPFLAKFSHLWLGLVAKEGHRSEVIHTLHEKYGALH